MHYFSHPRFAWLLALCLSAAIYTPSLADEITLVSIGPRMGLSGKTPLLGREQKYPYHLYDVAAVFRMPWSRPLGESPWTLETRLMTSAGILTGANEKGLMMTLIPEIALSGWQNRVTFDVGGGAAFFSRYKFGIQDFGGPAQFVVTAGVRVSPFPHAYVGFRAQHFSARGSMDPLRWAWICTS